MKLLSTFAIIGLFFLVSSFEGTLSTIPSVDVKTLDGETVNIKEYISKDKVTVISFWATWCSPCKRELDAIMDIYPDWQEDYDVELLAITIDDARSLAKVPALVETKGWEYTVLADVKRELQKALNFQTVPQTFLIDKNGQIVYTHSGYSPGDEYELEDEIKKLSE
ncbi:MAG: TlpA family protein disulfide reductase [Saprospiraceae bacterium]|nr:TlpA family protein disulfide reductase [Bacteroidia bacterium]NNE14132.1 TlpA family protein disulfide reductase [Saprospiraceae bacterium]NNL90955.1 TlpA family protein disulfide reductase [Saprospiraceae bacterium]